MATITGIVTVTFILHTVTKLLTTNQYVIVLMEKYAMLDIPDNIYNWLVAYFNGHSHCTTYRGQMSDPFRYQPV